MASVLSRIDAVNMILGSADMMPVNQIETNTTAEARLAVNALDAAHREVLNEGWVWNIEYEYELEASGDTGEVGIPADIMRFDPKEYPEYVQRGRKLYDRFNHTYVIGAAVKGTATFYQEWDDLNEEAKTYMARKAARRFHNQHVGAGQDLRSLVQDEQEALKAVRDADMDVGAYSIFDAPDMHAGLSRGNPYVGRAAFNGKDPFRNRDGGTV